MAITIGDDGWSSTLAISAGANGVDNATDPYDDESYSTNRASWYMRSWFGPYAHGGGFRWARKYVNNSNMTKILKSISFRVAPGHSNNKRFTTSDGTYKKVWGHGCKWFVKMYVKDADGNNKTESGEFLGGEVPYISQFNCSYGGRGNTDVNEEEGTCAPGQTGFGNENGYDVGGVDDNGDPWRGYEGHPRYRAFQQITIPEANQLKIPVGGSLYIHVYAKYDWEYWIPNPAALEETAVDSCLLSIKSNDSNFTSEMVVEDTDYIWVMTSEGWKKSKVAYEMKSGGWEALKE